MSEKPNWRESLKAGDEVMVAGGFSARPQHLAKVVKVTETQIVLPNNERYDKFTGYRRGDSAYNRCFLLEVTPEGRTKVAVANARYDLRKADWSKVSDDEVCRIAEIVRAAERRKS